MQHDAQTHLSRIKSQRVGRSGARSSTKRATNAAAAAAGSAAAATGVTSAAAATAAGMTSLSQATAAGMTSAARAAADAMQNQKPDLNRHRRGFRDPEGVSIWVVADHFVPVVCDEDASPL